MGLASMIIGIVALASCTTCGGRVAVIPAVIGLVLGVLHLVLQRKGGRRRGVAIVGVILNPLAIAAAVVMIFAFPAAEPVFGTWSAGPPPDPQPAQPGWQPLPPSNLPVQPMEPVPAPPAQPGQVEQPAQPQQPIEAIRPIQPGQAGPELQPMEPVPAQPSPPP
jgi:hypothetical protein